MVVRRLSNRCRLSWKRMYHAAVITSVDEVRIDKLFQSKVQSLRKRHEKIKGCKAQRLPEPEANTFSDHYFPQNPQIPETGAMDHDPKAVVRKLLANTSNPKVVTELVARDATYVSLSYANPPLTKIMPWAGTHTKEGPDAIIQTFADVAKSWKNEAFEIQALFGEGENVAAFGSFTYRSIVLDKVFTSPFAIWCAVKDGLITYMQFMEDTLGTASTFRKNSEEGTYISVPKRGEVHVRSG